MRQMAISVHRLDLRGFTGSILAVPRLRKLLRDLRANLVHTYQPWSGVAAQLAAPRDARVFRSVRGFVTGPRTLEQRVHAWLERRAARLRDRHFTVADALALDAVRRRFNVDQVEVVPECLDLAQVRRVTGALGEQEARLRMGLGDGQRPVAVLSDFRDRTGPTQILEGFSTARVERPGLRLFFLGGGPEEGAVRWRAEELRLEDSVVFLGTREGGYPALLRTCQAVIDAGSWPGWSRVSLEAMALGVPVLRWVQEDDDAGRARYPARTAGNSDHFAQDLLHVLDDGPTRARVTALGETEAQRYDVTTVADTWAEIYSR